MDTQLEIGKIINTHGVRGELKVDPWCDPQDVFPCLDEIQAGGEGYAVAGWRMHKGFVLLTLAGVDSMDAAVALKRLSADKSPSCSSSVNNALPSA